MNLVVLFILLRAICCIRDLIVRLIRNHRELHQNSVLLSFPSSRFYLLYAEAVNEIDPNDARVLTYLNKVRHRAGLENIEILNPDIAGKQDLQRLAIQRERRIELATEGQRYFDVRRWMIADQEGEGRQYGYVHGMNMNGTEDKFLQEVEASPIVFRRKMYLYPIPDSEMKKSDGQLVQNPGW